jgi:hypothetical protein
MVDKNAYLKSIDKLHKGNISLVSKDHVTKGRQVVVNSLSVLELYSNKVTHIGSRSSDEFNDQSRRVIS